MGRHKLYLSILIPLILTSCGSTMKIKGDATNKLAPLNKTVNVVIIEENENIDTIQCINALGSFEIKDGGFSLDCSYDRVKNIAKNKARSIGGNAVKITEHKLPDLWSTCHRIKFDVYNLDSIIDFQKEMIWSSTNKLNWQLFKGAPKIDNTSLFCGYIDVQFNDVKFMGSKGEVNICPIFLFQCSWVQPSKKNTQLLEYNQIKFDLLEIYSRMMRKEFDKYQIDTQDEWQKFAEEIYNKVYIKYNTEIFNLETETNKGEDNLKLAQWRSKVNDQLITLLEFSYEKY